MGRKRAVGPTPDSSLNTEPFVRAWLQTADRAKCVQQTQLRLISDNISLPVSTEFNVFESVMRCWTTAMVTMNDLVDGKPQRVQSGGLLLALSAWQLCPDISVQSTSPQLVKQGDHLVTQGGILTVGLQNHTNFADDGVYWSLPLAHLKVYGKPVQTTRYQGINRTQVTLTQLLCLTLGSIFSLWNVLEADLDHATEVVYLLSQAMQSGTTRWLQSQLPWLQMLGRAAKDYMSSNGFVRDEYARLIAYGHRRCTVFVAEREDTLPPFFGLTHTPTAFGLFTPYNDPSNPAKVKTVTERWADFLRQWANSSRHKFRHKLSGSIIRYRVVDKPGKTQSSAMRLPIDEKPERYSFSCTNVFAMLRTGTKRNSARIELPLDTPFLHWTSAFDPRDNSATDDDLCRMIAPGPGAELVSCNFIYGDPSTAAIYRPEDRNYPPTIVEERDIKPKELVKLLQERTFDTEILHRCIKGLENQDSISTEAFYSFFASLRVLEAAWKIYEHLTDAKVDLHLCMKSLCTSHFSRYLEKTRFQKGTRKSQGSNEILKSLKMAFSCITLFQTGHVDIDPEGIGRSYGNFSRRLNFCCAEYTS